MFFREQQSFFERPSLLHTSPCFLVLLLVHGKGEAFQKEQEREREREMKPNKERESERERLPVLHVQGLDGHLKEAPLTSE